MSRAPHRRDLLAGMAGLVVAGIARPAFARPLDKLKASGTMSVAVYRDFEPWSWRDARGQLVGIDIDIAHLLGEAIGVKVDIRDFLAGEDLGEDLRNMVWKGTVVGQPPADLMMHVPVDRKLATDNDRAVIFGPYYRENFAMVCNRDTTDCEVPPPELKGKRLVAEIASIPDFYLSGGFGGVLRGDVQHVPTGAESVAKVAAGEADATVASRAQVEHGISIGGTRAVARKGPLPAIGNPGWNVGLAVKDDSHDLGDALEQAIADLIANGKLQQAFARYGVHHVPPVLT